MPADVRNGRKARPSANGSGLLEAAERFWQKSYAADYLGLVIVALGCVVVELWDEPYHQMFRLDDPRIQHPHAEHERVDIFFLFIYAAIIPFAILLFTLVLWTPSERREFHKAHVTVLGLAISILFTIFVTDTLKNAIGRPRPDLLARCIPRSGTATTGLVTIDVCTEKNHHTLHDGWRSFPSGHSSFAFAGLGWLALFLASQTHALRPQAGLTVVLLCLAPVLSAALIAISRLEDYRHDVGDVAFGSVLGAFITYVNWKRYYPSLFSKGCDEPYSAPGSSDRSSPIGEFYRIRDEEEGAVPEEGHFSLGDDNGRHLADDDR